MSKAITTTEQLTALLAQGPDPREIVEVIIPQVYAAIELAETPEEINEVRSRVDMLSGYINDKIKQYGVERWEEYEVMHPAETAYVKASAKAGELWADTAKRPQGQNQSSENFPKTMGPVEAGFKSNRDATACVRAGELTDEEWRTYISDCKERQRHVTLSGAERMWSLRKAADDENAIPSEAENGLIQGDFRLVDIPSNSVDMIFTDPPYPMEFLHLYGDLAELAADWLKPGGVCIVYSAQWKMPDILDDMTKHLSYMWTAVLHYNDGKPAYMRKIHTQVRWKPLHIFYKPPFNAWWGAFDDVVVSERSKDLYEWQQPVSDAKYFIDIFTKTGELVLDPMMGVGTTPLAAKEMNREWLGIELNMDRFNIAKDRLS